MSFRDDGDALFARLAALEHEAARVPELELRIQQLTNANAELHRLLARTFAPAPPPAVVDDARRSLDRTILAREIADVLARLTTLERDGRYFTLEQPVTAGDIEQAARARNLLSRTPEITRDDFAAAVRDVLNVSLRVSPRLGTLDALVEMILSGAPPEP